MPWIVIPLSWLLIGVSFQHHFGWLIYFIVPIFAYFAYRYSARGLTAAAIACVPLLFGLKLGDTIVCMPRIGLVSFALATAYVCVGPQQADRARQALDDFARSAYAPLMLALPLVIAMTFVNAPDVSLGLSVNLGEMLILSPLLLLSLGVQSRMLGWLCVVLIAAAVGNHAKWQLINPLGVITFAGYGAGGSVAGLLVAIVAAGAGICIQRKLAGLRIPRKLVVAAGAVCALAPLTLAINAGFKFYVGNPVLLSALPAFVLGLAAGGLGSVAAFALSLLVVVTAMFLDYHSVPRFRAAQEHNQTVSLMFAWTTIVFAPLIALLAALVGWKLGRILPKPFDGSQPRTEAATAVAGSRE